MLKQTRSTHVDLEAILPQQVMEWVAQWSRTGSGYISEPFQDINDLDYVVLVDKDRVHDLGVWLTDNFWVLGGSTSEKEFSSHFTSYKMHKYNLIVTTNTQFFLKFVAATLLAKEMEVTTKKERVAVFEAVLDDIEKKETDFDKVARDINDAWARGGTSTITTSSTPFQKELIENYAAMLSAAALKASPVFFHPGNTIKVDNT